MIKGMQKILLELGNYGCYFLSIVEAAERRSGKEYSILPIFLEMKKKGFIGKDSYIFFPDKILSALTGKPYTIRHERKDYKAKAGEIEILRYEWRYKDNVSAHFVLGDGYGRIAYDPLAGSYTVQNGLLESKRIFTPVK